MVNGHFEFDVYVGCSLTQAPPWFRGWITRLKNMLRRSGLKVAEFVGTKKGTPRGVYAHDINTCVAKSRLFVAVCDLPAIGVGMEMGAALFRFGRPVFAVVRKGTKMSRLIIGASHVFQARMTVGEYWTISDLHASILEVHRSAVARSL